MQKGESQLHYKDCLTSELLLKRFKSQFDLVRHAIQIAVQKVDAEKDMLYPNEDARHISTEALEDIAEGIDALVEKEEMEEEVEEVQKPKAKKRSKA